MTPKPKNPKLDHPRCLVPTANVKNYTCRNKAGDVGELILYGVFGQDWFGDGITAKQVEKDLKKLGAVKSVDVRINSEGGAVHDARAIYNLLNQHPATMNVHIDGLAASAASFVAMAGDTISMAESGFFMIHNARMVAMGGAEDFDAAASFLRTVNRTISDTYQARTGNKASKIKEWMDAETWFTGKEALDNKFVTSIVENKKVSMPEVAAIWNYSHTPVNLRPNRARVAALMNGKNHVSI